MGKKDVRAAFRNAVFARDKFTCVVCGKKWTAADADPSLGRINAHHITDRHLMPNGGYVPENGVTVCDGGKDSCHMKCEQYHINQGIGWEGLYPADLYEKIHSSHARAVAASNKL